MNTIPSDEYFKRLIADNDRMTMLQLKEFVNKNGLFYCHIPGSKNLVAIYKDRYHYVKLGCVFVKDYRPIKNFRTRKFGFMGFNSLLRILKSRAYFLAPNKDVKIVVYNDGSEEYEIVKAWLEEKE